MKQVCSTGSLLILLTLLIPAVSGYARSKNFKGYHGPSYSTPLLEALYRSRWKQAEKLIRKHKHLNSSNSGGLTPLMFCAESRRNRLLKMLLETGKIQVNKQNLFGHPTYGDHFGWTALHYAAWRGNAEGVRLLLAHGADPQARSRRGRWRPVRMAVLKGDPETVRLLLKATAPYKRNSLFLQLPVTSPRAMEIATLLFRYKADVNAANRIGQTILFSVIFNTPFYSLKEHHRKLLEQLVRGGARVNIIDHRGKTPLLLAIRRSNLPLIRFLLAKGANPNLYGDKSVPPLVLAMHRSSRRMPFPTVVPLLFNHGARLTAIDRNGNKSVLHYAAMYNNGEILRAGVKQGVDPDIKDLRGYTALNLLALNRRPEGWRTLAALANPRIRDRAGRTALHNAARGGSAELIRYLVRQRKMNVNDVDGKGNTPLHIAGNYRNIEAARTLLVLGASRTIRNKRGQTPLQTATNGPMRNLLRTWK